MGKTPGGGWFHLVGGKHKRQAWDALAVETLELLRQHDPTATLGVQCQPWRRPCYAAIVGWHFGVDDWRTVRIEGVSEVDCLKRVQEQLSWNALVPV